MTVETAFELPLLFEFLWPSPVCPKDGTHQLFTIETANFQGLICDCCGTNIRLVDFQRIFEWWAYVESYSREDWGRN